jgi:hypothetical protein
MTAIQLDPQARAFLANVQHETGPIPAPIEQALTDATEKAGKALNLEEVMAAVQQALPSCQHHQRISKCLDGSKQAAMSHHCDGTRPDFLTQIFELKITKEIDDVYRTPPQRQPVRRDPLEASFNMAPDADFMLLFNARDVDRNGRPLLMKIVAREGDDPAKLDLAGYRTAEGWQRDVVTVGKLDDVVRI